MRDPNQVNPVTPLERLYSDFSEPTEDTMIDKETADAIDLQHQSRENGRIWQQEADLESARRGGKPLEYFQIKNSPQAGIAAAEAFLKVLRNSDPLENPSQVFSDARKAARIANDDNPLYDYDD